LNINYQKELDRILKKIEAGQTVPSLLLHSCCAPCSSYVLKYLSGYFRITDFYYNPNITDREEYKKRVLEMKRLLREMPLNNPVVFYEGTYEPEKFLEMSKGLENLPEGGERCFRCYEMRLREAAEKAS
jgi:predicted adenine nucleotide alpha hydrolase (AANH) superfamily ATPase